MPVRSTITHVHDLKIHVLQFFRDLLSSPLAARMVLSYCKHLQRGKQFCQGPPAPTRQPLCRPARLPAPQKQHLQPQKLTGAQICRAAAVEVQPEAAVPGMTAYLDTLRWSKDGLVPVIVQVLVDGIETSTYGSYECSTTQATGLCPAHPQAGQKYDLQYLHQMPAQSTSKITVQKYHTTCQILDVDELLRWCSICLPLLPPAACCLQHVDTGELLMQAYADRAALSETLQTK